VNLEPDIRAIAASLRTEGCGETADAIEACAAGGATGTEILAALQARLRAAAHDRAISLALRRRMSALSGRIDRSLKAAVAGPLFAASDGSYAIGAALGIAIFLFALWRLSR
jgi:hypothetical protein